MTCKHDGFGHTKNLSCPRDDQKAGDVSSPAVGIPSTDRDLTTIWEWIRALDSDQREQREAAVRLKEEHQTFRQNTERLLSQTFKRLDKLEADADPTGGFDTMNKTQYRIMLEAAPDSVVRDEMERYSTYLRGEGPIDGTSRFESDEHVAVLTGEFLNRTKK